MATGGSDAEGGTGGDEGVLASVLISYARAGTAANRPSTRCEGWTASGHAGVGCSDEEKPGLVDMRTQARVLDNDPSPKKRNDNSLGFELVASIVRASRHAQPQRRDSSNATHLERPNGQGLSKMCTHPTADWYCWMQKPRWGEAFFRSAGSGDGMSRACRNPWNC